MCVWRCRGGAPLVRELGVAGGSNLDEAKVFFWLVGWASMGTPQPYISPEPQLRQIIIITKGHLSRFGLPPLCMIITFCSNLQLGWGLKHTCSSHRELSNSVLHFTYTHRGLINSRLLVVVSQIASLTPDLSFCHNLCCRCPNGSCEPIFDMHTLIVFQWYK